MIIIVLLVMMSNKAISNLILHVIMLKMVKIDNIFLNSFIVVAVSNVVMMLFIINKLK